MPKYVIALPLSPLEAGDEFPAETWPLHLTLVPTFEVDLSVDELVTVTQPLIARAGSLTVVGESDELFGPRHDVPVTTVLATDELVALHHELLKALEPRAAHHLKPAYIGDGYRPHVSHTATDSFGPGETATVRQVAIVDMQRRGADKTLAVVATIELA